MKMEKTFSMFMLFVFFALLFPYLYDTIRDATITGPTAGIIQQIPLILVASFALGTASMAVYELKGGH